MNRSKKELPTEKAPNLTSIVGEFFEDEIQIAAKE
jgi:hypothetical protein